MGNGPPFLLLAGGPLCLKVALRSEIAGYRQFVALKKFPRSLSAGNDWLR